MNFHLDTQFITDLKYVSSFSICQVLMNTNLKHLKNHTQKNVQLKILCISPKLIPEDPQCKTLKNLCKGLYAYLTDSNRLRENYKIFCIFSIISIELK